MSEHTAVSIAEIDVFLQSHSLALLYIIQQGWGVCHAVAPKLSELLADFPQIAAISADIQTIPALAGKFAVFTAPVILLYADGKEQYRQARFVHMAELRNQLETITQHD